VRPASFRPGRFDCGQRESCTWQRFRLVRFDLRDKREQWEYPVSRREPAVVSWGKLARPGTLINQREENSKFFFGSKFGLETTAFWLALEFWRAAKYFLHLRMFRKGFRLSSRPAPPSKKLEPNQGKVRPGKTE
jgi:hypothetical protein